MFRDLIVFVIFSFLFGGIAFAQEETGDMEQTASSDAAQANNPLADFRAFNLQNYYIPELSGPIDAKLVSELTPRILELRSSPDPITLLIDSPGGSVARTQTLFDLLSVPVGDAHKLAIFHVVAKVVVQPCPYRLIARHIHIH